MLMPKRVKYRKPHSHPRIKGLAKSGTEIAFGEFGLKALEPKWITARQIEAARTAVARYMKKGGKLWIRIFPDKAITKHPAETRMGKGKGAPEKWAAVVRPGRVLYEIGGMPEAAAREALNLAAYKLPIRTRIIARD
ncbi:MAG TPA: 50S ribosomal protein L16 [Elusimicrobia bacterium]|nr:50S ribosomal protein L16 [Elusimicrobiota bacterium]